MLTSGIDPDGAPGTKLTCVGEQIDAAQILALSLFTPGTAYSPVPGNPGGGTGNNGYADSGYVATGYYTGG